MPKPKKGNDWIWIVAVIILVMMMSKPELYAVRLEDVSTDCEAFRQNKIDAGYKVSGCTLVTSSLVNCIKATISTADVGEYIMFYDWDPFPQGLPEREAKAYECIYGPINYGPTECPNYCYTANDNAAYRGGNYAVPLDTDCPSDKPHWLYFNAQGGIAGNMGGGTGTAVLQCCYSTKQFCGSLTCNRGYCTSGSCNTEADTNCDGKVNFNEFTAFATLWLNNQKTFSQFQNVAIAWLNG